MKNLLSAILFFWFLAATLYSQDLSLNEINKNTFSQSMSGMPVSFRQNQGQWDDNIIYQGFSPGWNANINFMKNGLSFGLCRKVEGKNKFTPDQHPTRFEKDQTSKERLVWNIYFKGMNSDVSFVPEGKQESRVNYLIGNDPSKHAINVPDYKILNYTNVYNGIDVKYYSTGKNIKYDFVIKPGADISKIQMECKGIKHISLNAGKQLEITNEWGTLLEEMPESYQVINGKKILVPVEYKILNDNTFGFTVNGNYDKSQTLIIDPVILAWSTFVGATGTLDEGYCFDVAVDPAGYVYSTGFYEGNFPVTPGAYNTTFVGQQDVFVYKMKPDASALVYGTYMGGSNIDWGYGIAVNTLGEAYVTGITASSTFPVTAGAYQTTFKAGGFDAFVTKLNASGTAAVYSTFVGGTADDEGYDIAINAAGEAYITGVASVGFPVTPGAFQTTISAGYGAMVAKLNSSGSALDYAAILGGSLGNYGYGIAVGPGGEAFVTGETGSWANTPPNYTDFPITTGAFKTNYGNCGWKGFITKINSSGTSIVYSSLLGGTGNCPQNGADVGEAVTVNAAGEAFIVGNTGSSNFYTSPGAYDQTFSGVGDVFLIKLNASGSAAIYSTYYGGDMGETVCGVAVNSADEAFISGFTETDDGTFPITSCAYQSVFGGQSTANQRGDIFVAKFNASGSTLLYSTFMGGNSDDYKYPHVALHGPCEEEVIVNGTSHSQNFATTAGVFMPAKGNGNEDQPVVFKLKPKINPLFIFTNPNCNLTVNFKDTTTGVCIWQAGSWSPSTWHWDFGDGTTSTQQNPTHTYAASGTYNVKLIVTCPKDSIILPVTVNTAGGVGTIPTVPPICAGSSAVLTASGGSGYTWNTGATTATITVSPTVTTTYTVIITGSCVGSATTTVVVNPSPSPSVTVGNSPACLNQTLSLNASGGTTYSWSGPNSFTSSVQNPTIPNVTIAAAGMYTVTIANSNSCIATGTTNVMVFPLPVITASNNGPICGGQTLNLTGNGGANYSWTGPGSFISSVQNPSVANVSNNTGGTYSVTAIDSNGCGGNATTLVVINPTPLIDHINSPEYCTGQTTQQINVSCTPGGSTATFFWTNLNTGIGLAGSGGGNIPSFITVNTSTAAVSATILVHASYNGCNGPDSMFTITVNPIPTAAFSATGKICQGNAMHFTDLSVGNIAQWNWDMDNNGTVDATSQDPSYTFNTTGTHTVSLVISTGGNSCKDTVEKTVYVNPIPTAAFTGDHLKGCPVLNVNFTDHSSVQTPSTIVSWNWDFGNGSTFNNQFPPTVAYDNTSSTQNTTFTVSLTVVSDSGCTVTITKPNYITVYPKPRADFYFSSNINETDGIDATVHYFGQSTGASSMHWNLGDVFANLAANYTTVQNPSHVYLHEDAYSYYVTQWVVNNFGCVDSITKVVEVKPGFSFYIPNAFTPNEDALNEGFKGTGVGIDNANYRLLIFDRWGNQIFEGRNLETAWDGRLKAKGDVVQEDVYTWKVDFKDLSGMKHEYKGIVNVVK